MKIRTKLILTTNAVLICSMALLGYGIIAAENAYKMESMENSAKIIENSAVRVAMDALLQKDELQLVSYVNFLKSLYPALAYAKIDWRVPGRVQNLTLGQALPKDEITESKLQVMDPEDTRRLVRITLGIDKDVLNRETRQTQWRLEKIVAAGWLISSFVGMLLIYFLSGTLTRKIKSLAALAAEIGSGKLGRKLEWSSQDEIGDLARAVNVMSDRLSELDEAKKNFVSSVTHELRSPLGAIESFLGLIEMKIKEGSPQSLRDSYEYIERIKTNTGRLGKFINELLDAAKFEKGRMICALNPMDLSKAAQEACDLFQAKAQKQGVAVQNEIAAPFEIIGDAEKLRQVFGNLVSNSLKFTPAGGRITLFAERFRNDTGRWAEISVSDTGSGISEKDSQGLFTPFSQGKNASRTQEKGTGLGLYIVKSIIEQHGGKINFHSEPGKGTTVSFTVRTKA
ncbi:MAG: HAMP domain-containing protein [Elusimicrobia bacterium]|nr:HAMP domain-containing protein [Elusimicrobiota bacterium]